MLKKLNLLRKIVGVCSVFEAATLHTRFDAMLCRNETASCVCAILSVVAATQSSAYASPQATSYAAVPGASPYGATQTVVTPGTAYAAPSADQQYAQSALGQPGNAMCGLWAFDCRFCSDYDFQ